MWRTHQGRRVFLCLGSTDMRKSINSLSILVEHDLEGQLEDGDYFVFCSKSKRIIKILYWDFNGYCLWQKRLEKERFKWPVTDEDLKEITQQSLDWLLQGLDIKQAHERLNRPISA